MTKLVFLLCLAILHSIAIALSVPLSITTTPVSDIEITPVSLSLDLEPVDPDPTSDSTLERQCLTCENECRPYNISRDGGLCKCDTDCEVYGDCCGTSPIIGPEACQGTAADANLDGLQFTCQSIFLDSLINVMKHEAFWMVSTCRLDWIDETVMEGCISKTRDLPPVTDIVTGVVYKNQHCALCNHVESSNTLPWEASIVCTSYLYQLLTTTPISELNASIFQEQCRPCSYQPPSSVRPPRACYPTDNTCSVLLKSTTNTTDISSCVNGSYNLQSGYSKLSEVTRVYRNSACADCNAASSKCLVEQFRGTNFIPNQCVPDIASPTVAPTTMNSLTTSSFSLPPFPTLINETTGNRNNNNNFASLIPLPDIVSPTNSQGIPFTITLSNLGGGQVYVKTETESVNVTVECPEGQAPVGLECRKTVCPENFISVDGRCFSQQAVDQINSDNQTASDLENGTFLDCPSELVPLNDTEYTQVSNNTVLVDGVVMEVLGYSEDGQPLICPDNVTTVEVTRRFFSYPAGFIELTYVGCSLSVIGSALVLITYGLFKELRSLPSKILMNLAFANLATNLLILIGGPVSQVYPIAQLCTTVAILLHFFFLAQFSWMSIMSYDVVRKFYRARSLIVDSERDKLHLLISYVLIGWGLPLLLVTVCIIVNFTTSNLVLYGVLADGSLGSCWINHLETALIAFVAPLILSISFNLVMFLVVTAFIITAYRSQAKIRKQDSTPLLHLNIAIFCTTGLTWIFGFIAILAGDSWAWYLFIIFNSTQGFVIFVAFLFTKKTLKLYISCFTCRSVGKSSKSSSVNSSQTTIRLQKQNTLDNISNS